MRHYIFYILCAVSCLSLPALQAAEIKAGDQQAVPDLRWQDAEGKTHRLSDTSGKTRILHFWAAWCVPCREEMPALLQWQAEHPDIKVILLSLDQRMAQTRYFIKKHKLAMPPLLLNKEDSDALGIPALPYTLFVSQDGRLVGRHYGMAPWSEAVFSAQVTRLFSSAE